MTIENFKKIVDMEVSYTWTKMSIISAAEQYAKDFAKSELNGLLLEQYKIVIPGYREENWVPVRTIKEEIAKLEE